MTRIFIFKCEVCKPRYFTASHRVEAAKTAHYIATGHSGHIEQEIAA